VSQKAIRMIAIGLLVVAGIAGAASISYFLQQRRVEQLSAQLAVRNAQLETLAEKVSTLESELASPGAAPAGDVSADPDAQSAAEPLQPKPEPTTLRQFAFVRKATDREGKLSLVVDFAQFLTGTAAAEAAATAGDESPPPNDYYISNANPKLRTFGVAKGTKFVVVGEDPNDTDSLSTDEFYDAIDGNTDGAKDAPYWFTITNGVITAGEEQWTP